MLDVLRRTGEPVTLGELVRRVLAENGQGPEDEDARHYVIRKTAAVLARQEKRGVIRAVREPGRLLAWEVAS